MFLHAPVGRHWELPGIVCGVGHGPQGVHLQIVPQTALYIGACPGQVMKLVVSILSGPKQWELRLALREKSHSYD